MTNCLHCGTPNPTPDDQFCCTGCEFVYETLTGEGFERFYELKGSANGIPVKDRPFQPQDLAWLENAHRDQQTLTVAINGVTCIGCVWLIEKLFLRLPGAGTAAIFPDSGQAVFTWQEGTAPLLELAKDLPRYGYTLSPLDVAANPVRESSKILARLGLSAAFAMNAMAFSLPRYMGMGSDFQLARAFSLVTLISATFALLLGGSYFFTRAIAALRRKTIHLDLPIALGLLLAFLGSLVGYFLQIEKLLYFDFVATFTTLMLGGRYLHLAASERARSNLTRTNALPETVTLVGEKGKNEKPENENENENGPRASARQSNPAVLEDMSAPAASKNQISKTQKPNSSPKTENPIHPIHPGPNSTSAETASPGTPTQKNPRQSASICGPKTPGPPDPSEATREIPTRALSPGHTFLLPPGQPLPVTAFLRDSAASLSLAWINGEPEPREFHPGQRVPSGAVNLTNRPLALSADEAFADSLVHRLTQPAERNEASPLLQAILKIYLTAVILIGLGGGLVWWLTTRNPVDALHVTLSIFVVSCPCALGVAIPLADRRAATHLQAFGVFVQNSALWGRLLRVKNLVLDKTGTLTLEHPALANPEALAALSPEERAILLHLTSPSLHPLARTLHAAVAADRIRQANPFHGSPVTETPGQGLSCEIDGHVYRLGKDQTDPTDYQNHQPGPTTTFTRDDILVATFHFHETARPDAARALAATDLPVTILSGDQSERVKALAASLQLDPARAHGDLSPDDKAARVTELNPALFLGDGANDSLAFDLALATGSPVADRSLLDTKADFLFTQPALSFLPRLLAASHWRHRIVRRILIFTILYNLIAVAICLAGHMNPLLAAILMPLSSLASLGLASARIPKEEY